MTGLQFLSQLREVRGQSPTAVDIRVIQTGGLTPQRNQVVQRIEYLFSLTIATFVAGDGLIQGDNLDSIREAFHGHRLKGIPPGNTVAILVHGHGLILVDLALTRNRRVTTSRGKRDRQSAFLCKTCLNRFAAASDCSLLILLTSPVK